MSVFENLEESEKKYKVLDILNTIETENDEQSEALNIACEFLERWWEC